MKQYSQLQIREGWFRYPIKNKEAIKKLLEFEGRDGLLIAMGLYSGLRNSEIISLKWADVLDEYNSPKHHIKIFSSKQSNMRRELVTRTIVLVDRLKDKIRSYYDSLGKPPQSRYIFYRKNNIDFNRPLTPKGANDILKARAEDVGLKGREVSMHSLRKTMILNYHEANGSDWMLTCVMMNYNNPRTLARYLGITQTEVMKGYKDFYADQYLSLEEMIENGKIPLNVLLLIKNKNVEEWMEIVINYLLLYTDNEVEVTRVARTILSPYVQKKKVYESKST